MTDNEKKIKNKRSGITTCLFAIFLSLIVATIGGYLYYYELQFQKKIRTEIDGLHAIVNNNILPIRVQNEQIKSRIDGIESEISIIKSGSNQHLPLFHINELISMANQSLLVYGDVRSTLKLLQYANDILSNNNEAQYIEIKSAITNDIAKLGQLQYIDSVALSSKINTIIDQITSIPIIGDDKSAIKVESTIYTSIDNGSNKASLWTKFIENIKSSLKSLVLVTSTNNRKAIELLPEKEIIVRQNIKLYLLNARIALLQHDQNSWKFNLTNVDENLKDYFIKTTLLSSIINNIDDLLKVDISMENANIDDTLKALNKLNDLQK
ncbi:MAG: uroporphyrinogen-III C-methyltransferase [Neisseriaceae bacterium]